ncbi:hypothetical protein [Pseudomonas veronii]|uniref:hypothetical protein n=1 Tax=Pseudomonas veronii TaxID=76761 RepID=UPI0015A0C792|nr:hypothetical protein [Pseudomonas veronii]NWC56558.1 hypothetical protein [Pseudomonas veronii]
MVDLICRKSMTRSLTPGMCSPHGGCQAPENASAFRALLAERNSLAYLLKRFVDGEHDQDENQAERHMYHDEAQTLLAYLGGQVQGYTLVPDDALRALTAERDALRKGLTDVFNHIECNTECLVRDLVNWGTPKINPNDFYAECETIKAIASAGLNADVATPSTDNENVSRHEV